MKKNLYEDNSSKMNYLIQKIDKLKQNRNSKIQIKHSKSSQRKSSISSRKNTLKNNFLHIPSNDNLIQNNQIDIHSKALETLTDAALNVKNLLSDFLVNADPDDKKVFHIEDELKRINNNYNDSLNIYTLIGGNDSDKELINSPIESKIHYEKEDRKSNNYYQDEIYSNRKKRNKKNELTLESDEKSLLFKRVNSINSIQNKFTRNSFNPYEKSSEFDHNLIKLEKRKISALSMNNNYNINLNLNQRRKSSFSSINNNFNRFEKRKKIINDIIQNKNNIENKKSLSLKSLYDISGVKNNNDNSNSKLNISDKSSNDESEINLRNIIKKKNKNNTNKLYSKRNSYTFSIKDPKQKNSNNTNRNSVNTYNLSINYVDDNKIENNENENKKKPIRKKKKSFSLIEDDKKLKNNETNIQNYVNLSKKGLKKFKTLCNNLKESIIMFNPEKKTISQSIIHSKNQIKKNSLFDNEKTIIENKNFEEDGKSEKNSLISNLIESNNSNEIRIREIQFRRLIKQNSYVYDSLSDEECLEETEGEFYINPNGIFLFFYDMLLLFLSIYAIIFPPLNFAFKNDLIPNFTNFDINVDYVIDFFFLIDFFIGFFTAYFDFEEQLITNNKLILKHYLKTWLIINFISGIPFNSILTIIDYYKKKNTLIYSNIYNLWKILNLLRLLRLLKLFKTFTNNSFTHKIHIKISRIDTIILKWFTLYMSLFIFFISVHLLSCVFIFLSTLSHPNWIYINDLESSNKIDIYIASLYYICATIFTIGYGDIVSISIYERFFNLILLVVGIMIYSFSVSALSNYVQSVDSKTLDYRNKIETLEQIRLTHEKMPQNLFDKISKFLLFRLHHGKKDKNEIIDNLPLALRNKLIIEMYKDIINNFIFFKNFNNSDFIIRVILALKPIQASKNERLVNEGDYIEEIIFVQKGRLSLEIPIPVILKKETIKKIQTIRHSRASLKFNLTKNISPIQTLNEKIPNEIEFPTEKEINEENTLKNFHNHINQRQYIKIIEIRKNEHFGDILMFLNKRSPLCVKVKSKYCDLFLLKKTEAVEISMDFPSIWRKIIKKSLFNMEQIERLINKALKFFYIRNEGNNKNRKSNENNEIQYYRIDPSKGNRLFNDINLLNSLRNNVEQFELKSIPSEENEDNEDENEEKEEFDEYNENNNSNIKRATNIKTIIKEEDENSSLDSKSINSNKSNYSKNSSKSDNSNYSIKSNKSNNEDKLNNSDNNSNKSSKSRKTIITNPKNYFFENISESNYENNKEKGTLISSTLPYSAEEINNESFPFEEPITINKSETLFKNLLPKEIEECTKTTNYISIKSNESIESVKKKFPNSILMLLNNPFFTNKNINNMNNLNNNQDNLFIKKSSFDLIKIQKIESFTLKAEQKLQDFATFSKQFEKSMIQNNKSNDNWEINLIRTSSTPTHLSEIKKFYNTKTIIKSPHQGNYSDKYNSQIGNPIKRRLSKIMFSKKENETESPSSLKQTNNNITFNDMIDKSNIQKRKSSVFFGRNSNFNFIENTNIKNNDNKNEESNIFLKKNNTNTLDIIRNNIEKNSLNLNNPQFFYSEYFSSVINNNNENNTTKEFNQRLKNIAKIIEEHNKIDSNVSNEKEMVKSKDKT